MAYLSITDLENAKLDVDHIDEVTTSLESTSTDRKGHTKRTLAGWGSYILDKITGLFAGMGYAPPVAYVAGIAMTNPAHTVGYAGNVYAPNLADLPFTTSGTFETAKFRLIQGVAGIDLGNTTNQFLGAGMVGSADIGNYFANNKVEQILQELGDPRGKFQAGGVNVLRYIAPSLWAAILAGTSTADHYAALQAAFTAEPNLVLVGRLNTSQPLVPRADGQTIQGIGRRQSVLRALGAITIIQTPYLCDGLVIKNLWFQGPAGYKGIAPLTTTGDYQGYLIKPTIQFCDFDYAINGFGIDADLIYANVADCDFGFHAVVQGAIPAPGAGTFCGIRSLLYPGTNNYTNANLLQRCRFNGCGSSDGAVAAIDLQAGVGWTLRDCDASYGGVALRTQNLQLIKFEGTTWFEGNSSTTRIVLFGTCLTPIKFHGVNFASNTCFSLVQASILDGNCAGIDWAYGSIGKTGASYCFFDGTAVTTLLPANGKMAFYDNQVSGGNSLDKFVSATDFRGGSNAVRISGNVTTAGGAITSFVCSDPGATASYNGLGDVSIVASHPIATTAARIVPSGNFSTGYGRVLKIAPNQIRVQVFALAGSALDGTADFSATGS